MEIYNTDAKETETITYLCNGQDMAGELASDSNRVKYNPDRDRYEANNEEIRYWEKCFEETGEADDMENDLKEMLRELERKGYWRDSFEWIRNKIDEVNNEAGWCDFEQVPRERQKLYRELYKEVQEWWNGKNEVDQIEGYWRLEEV